MRRTRANRPRSKTRRRATRSSDISDGDLLQQLDQDDELIPQIAGIELTERLSTLTLYRSYRKIQSRRACAAGVGAIGRSLGSAEAACREQLPQPPPDAEAQRTMFKQSRALRAGRAVSPAQLHGHADDDAIRRLSPYFEIFSGNDGSRRLSSRWIDTTQDHVSGWKGSHGRASRGRSRQSEKIAGLESRGEFGAEAAVVLMDLEKGTIGVRPLGAIHGGPGGCLSIFGSQGILPLRSHRCLPGPRFVSRHSGYHGEIAWIPSRERSCG